MEDKIIHYGVNKDIPLEFISPTYTYTDSSYKQIDIPQESIIDPKKCNAMVKDMAAWINHRIISIGVTVFHTPSPQWIIKSHVDANKSRVIQLKNGLTIFIVKFNDCERFSIISNLY